MSFNRRKLARLVFWGSTSFLSTSSIFFPKPAETYQLTFQLSNKRSRSINKNTLNLPSEKDISLIDATSDQIFGNITQNTDLQRIGKDLPPVNQPIRSTVESIENEFIHRQFIEGKTFFAKTDISLRPGFLWGRQKQERVGPNAGLATVQFDQETGELITANFSGAITVGIAGSTDILTDQKISPSDISKLLIPSENPTGSSGFADWLNWEESAVNTLSYRTRRGEVFRRYNLIEPGYGGFGIIEISIESELQPRREIIIKVLFAKSSFESDC